MHSVALEKVFQTMCLDLSFAMIFFCRKCTSGYLQCCLFFSDVSSFVLSLWKYFHITRTLAEGGVAVGVVEDIAPMHLTQLLTLQRGAAQTEHEEIPQVYKNIMVAILMCVCTIAVHAPLYVIVIFWAVQYNTKNYSV